jgi:pSer/pThr/pTyr-binding forkhead associated (FHA) protein
LDLYSGGARIGRDATVASIVINDRRVSRYHCRISEESNGSFSIWDEGSTSGTYVNNEQVTMSGRTLQAGDLINFGPLQYRFEPAGSSQLGTGDATEPFVRTPA